MHQCNSSKHFYSVLWIKISERDQAYIKCETTITRYGWCLSIIWRKWLSTYLEIQYNIDTMNRIYQWYKTKLIKVEFTFIMMYEKTPIIIVLKSISHTQKIHYKSDKKTSADFHWFIAILTKWLREVLEDALSVK